MNFSIVWSPLLRLCTPPPPHTHTSYFRRRARKQTLRHPMSGKAAFGTEGTCAKILEKRRDDAFLCAVHSCWFVFNLWTFKFSLRTQ